MPFTFSHPAAILPLITYRRLRPSALIIGSMVPDFGYYFPLSNYFSISAHTPLRSLTFCVPVGCAIFILFFLTRVGWAALMPEPFHLWLARIAHRERLHLKDALMVPAAVFAGAWTHLIWNSITHRNGWSVEHVTALQTEIFFSGYHVYNLLQHASTTLGLLFIAVALNRTSKLDASKILLQKQTWFLIAVLTIPLAFVFSSSPMVYARTYQELRLDSFAVAVRSLRISIVVLFAFAVYLTSVRIDGKPQPS